MSILSAIINFAHNAHNDVVNPVTHLFSQPIQNHPNHPQTIAFNPNPGTMPLHSPQQIQQVAPKATPTMYLPPVGVGNPYQGFITPHPLLDNLDNLSASMRLNSMLNSLPVPANHGGALPPSMVNVPWSAHQIPYQQSLHPPRGY